MSFDLHPRRFDPRWLFPAIETVGEETSKPPVVSLSASSWELTSELTERDIDLALEQVASERCCVCPLCGAIVRNDGTVLS
jgi:hypothetical protein